MREREQTKFLSTSWLKIENGDTVTLEFKPTTEVQPGIYNIVLESYDDWSAVKSALKTVTFKITIEAAKVLDSSDTTNNSLVNTVDTDEACQISAEIQSQIYTLVTALLPNFNMTAEKEGNQVLSYSTKYA